MDIQERIAVRRVLSAAVIDSPDYATPIAKALLAGGLDVMEVTLRNEHAAECIRRIRDEVPEMLIGAGTLLSEVQIDQAISAGAQFGVSPGFNPTVVRAAVERDFFFFPGIMTPGEIEQSLELGCPWVKYFPASAAGGVKFIQALSACYSHTQLRIIPLGGVNLANMTDYLQLPLVVAVGGSWLTDRKLAAARAWPSITSLAQNAVDTASSVSIAPVNSALKNH